MANFESALTAEDHAFRHTAEAYFEEKAKIARTSFDAKLLAVFGRFEQHWRHFFAPDDAELAQEYLTIPFEVRKGQFERFRRECRAWEVSFRHCTKGQTQGGRPGNGSGLDWSDLKRRVDAQRDRADQVREFYDHLDSLLDRERRRRAHPAEIIDHLRALGVGTDASLDEIKRQYKRLAMLNHPDRKGDARRMSQINDSYRAILAYYRVSVRT